MKAQLLQLSYLKWSNLLVCACLTLLYSSSLSAQHLHQDTIRIVDENNHPLVGVVVQSQGKLFQGVSDDLGQLIIDKKVDQLRFSFLGYATQTIQWDQIIRQKSIVQLQPSSLDISEIVVLGRTDMQVSENHHVVEVIDKNTIALLNPQTSADALSHQANVFVQKSQMGGGSPVIRGFEANKVLLVVDGVRMNNAIYRNGHLQNAITVNSTMLDQIEVIYGPGSLMYGSDALGGVVHFRTREPRLSFRKENKEIQFFTRYASANQEKSGHLSFELGSAHWASLSSVSFSDFSDLRMGAIRTEKYPDYAKRTFWVSREQGTDRIYSNSNPNIQIGTAYSQWDFLQKFLFQPSVELKQVFNIQYSSSSNIPRYDALTEWAGEQPVYAEWYYGPQSRFLASSKTRWSRENKFWDKITLLSAYQVIGEERISRNYGSEWKQNQNEAVQVVSANLDMQKNFADQHIVEYGMEFIYNHLRSTAFTQNIDTEIINQEILTRYPNGRNKMNTYGIYALYTGHSTNSKLSWHGGLRYSGARLQIQYQSGDGFLWPENYYRGIQSNNQALTWSGGIQLKTEDDWMIGATASSAFRSPNIDDFAKIRIKRTNVTVPNISLGPEKSLNGEFVVNKKFNLSDSKMITIATTVFYTHLYDAIVRRNFQLPNGSNTIHINGTEYNTQANVNARQAYIYGLSLNTKLELDAWQISGSINRILGRIIGTPQNVPLAHIPPVYGKMTFEYGLPACKLYSAIRFNGAKPSGLMVQNPWENMLWMVRTMKSLLRKKVLWDG